VVLPQAVQADRPLLGAKSSSLVQPVHADWPSEAAIVPARHDPQVDSAVAAVAEEALPLAHRVQALPVNPVVAWYDPAAHAVQVLAPVWLAPALQL